MGGYAIMRCEKVKSGGRAAVIHAHNTRSSNPINANPTGHVVALVPCADLPAAIDARIESAGATRRANSVIAQEMILTASPEFFRPGDPAKSGHYDRAPTKAWMQASREWLKVEFGDRLISAHLHLDESTPHIHAVIVPLTKDNRLSAKDLFNPQTLQRMQGSYAESVAHLGLQRGIEGSTATHEQVRQYYGRVNGPAPAPAPTIPTPPMLGREQWAADQTRAVAEAVEPAQAQAREMQRAQTKADQDRATLEKWRQEAARVRDIPLTTVLESAGLYVDPDDRHQWRGPGMRISVGVGGKDGKWYDHEAGRGGGGAIDLALHVTGNADFRAAVAWLGGSVGQEAIESAAMHSAREQVREASTHPVKSAPPDPDPSRIPQVRQYLTEARAIAPQLVDWAITTGRLYADARGNAVFRYGENAEGVELRGTTGKPFNGWRGPKQAALFDIPAREPQAVAVVESAIDAISYYQLHPTHTVVATGGGCSDEALVAAARIAHQAGLPLLAAFDRDATGEKYTIRLARCAGFVGGPDATAPTREMPKGKDWNEDLQAMAARRTSPEAAQARMGMAEVRQHLAARRDAQEARSADEELGQGPSRGR